MWLRSDTPSSLRQRLRLAQDVGRDQYAPAIFIGLCYMAITTMWTLYSAYVPVLLQVDYGLRATAIGAVMMLDNLTALLIQPWIGARSDRLRSRWGKRLPFIVVSAPVAAVGFALIPLVHQHLDGLATFVGVVMVMLVAMAAMRVPLFALLPDLIPPDRRSTANGIINVFGGIGIMIATVGLGWLYRLNRAGPFAVAGILLLITTGLLSVAMPWLRQRYAVQPEQEGESPPSNSLLMLKDVLAENWRGVPLLLVAIFLYTFGINAVETFFTLYGRNVLALSEEMALMMLGVFFLTYMLASVPSGMVGERHGRQRVMILGLTALSGLVLLAFVVRTWWGTLLVLPLGGLAWAAVNANALPLLLAMSPPGHAGSAIGLYYASTTLASIVSPLVNGKLIDIGNEDYNLAILATSVAAGLAALTMLGMGRWGRRR
ncbi:MAG: MFS transporter [Anaerolineae bacterium]|nr:MFS transporter [Anaerolineae bacterium]